MAELAKKLNIKKSGATTTCKIYSTTAEAGSSYASTKVDNVAAYVPLVATNDGRASAGRITKSGSTQAIASTGKPPYTEKSWTTAGTYTWTCPVGITRIRAAVCGGGGGGAYNEGTGGSGDTSFIKNNTVSILQATGGSGGKVVYYEGEGLKTYQATGGTPNGRAGEARAYSPSKGGTGFALSLTLNDGTYGQGGATEGGRAWTSGGGSGGYNSGYISVSPNTVYTIKVGTGGSKANNDAYNGNNGFVLIAFGGDI